MRLSDWRSRAPHKDAMTPKVLAVIEPVLESLGAEPDPSAWVVWGEDPGVRYVLLVPTDTGLLQVLVRVNAPGEGPRASAKVIRWPRVQVGELGLEVVSGHRLLGFQVESHVLRGSDDEGDAIAAFALELLARIDGRPFTPRALKAGRSGKATGSRSTAGGTGTRSVAKPAAMTPGKAAAKSGAQTLTKGAARQPATASPRATGRIGV